MAHKQGYNLRQLVLFRVANETSWLVLVERSRDYSSSNLEFVLVFLFGKDSSELALTMNSNEEYKE